MIHDLGASEDNSSFMLKIPKVKVLTFFIQSKIYFFQLKREHNESAYKNIFILMHYHYCAEIRFAKKKKKKKMLLYASFSNFCEIF